MERDESGFRLRSPVEAEADSSEVDLLLQNLATMELERAVAKASEVELEPFGLEAPELEVRFTTEDGRELGLAFGGETPTGNHRYARRLEGEDVLVLASHLSSNLNRSAWDLREKSIYDIDEEAEPTRIALTRPEDELVLEKENGLWYLIEPVRSRADRYQATGLVSRFVRAEMAEIASETTDDAKEYGLASPAYTLRVDFEDEAVDPLVLRVGDSRELEYYASTPARPEIFLIDSSLVEELQTGPGALQSKKLFEYSTYQVNRVRIASGEEPRVLEKEKLEEGTRWLQVEPEPRELDTKAVEDLLYKLNGTSAVSLLDEPSREELGLAEPVVTITVWSSDSNVEEEVALGAPRGGRVYAQRTGDEVALELEAETWEEIEELLALEPGEDTETES